MVAFNRLNKKEKAHLRKVADCRTLTQFKHMAAEQAKMRKIADAIELCWECKFIAIKLGLEV